MATSASLIDFAVTDRQPAEVSLSFGKHRGVPLTQVETSYLEWVKTADRCTPDLLAAIDAELATRKPKAPIQDRWRAPSGAQKDVIDMARLLVMAGELAMTDAGITDQALTGAANLLRTCLDDIERASDPGTLQPF